LIKTINRIIRGWGNYYCRSQVRKRFHQLDGWIVRRRRGFGAATMVTPKFLSPSDPAAQWTGAMRGPAFFAYSDNYLTDVKFGIIMASRSIRQAEVGASKAMIERTQERFDIKAKRLGDTAYEPQLACQRQRYSLRTSRVLTSRSARSRRSGSRINQKHWHQA